MVVIERPRTAPPVADLNPPKAVHRDPEGARRRFPGLDAVRVLALLTVIVIHADHWPLQGGGTDRLVWSTVDELARVAVPLFVILSGFLMAYGRQDRVPWRTFATRRLTRSLLPWLVWAPVYALVGVFLTGEVPAGWQGIGGWLSLGAGHLWFLILVPQLYILFRVWPRSRRGTVMAAVLALLVQTGLCAYRLWAPAAAPLNSVFLANGFELSPFWIGYFGIGVALGARFARSRPRWPAWPFWLAVPAGAALLLSGVDVSGAASPDFAQGTGAFLRPALPLLAASVFLATALSADRLLARHRRLQAAMSLIGRYSLGIYIVHEALMYIPGRLLAGALLQHPLPTSLAGVGLLVPATLALATLVTRAMVATPLAATLGSRREPLTSRPGKGTRGPAVLYLHDKFRRGRAGSRRPRAGGRADHVRPHHREGASNDHLDLG